MIIEYPKSLYLRGWADLSATVVVENAAEEAEARAAGYRMLSDPPEPAGPAEEVAAGDSIEAEVVPPDPRRRRSA